MNINNKIARFSILLILGAASCSLQSMFYEKIEQALALKEINKGNAQRINDEIDKIPELDPIKDILKFNSPITTGLHIVETFHKKNTSTDSLTQDIFDEIAKIESTKKYRPDCIRTQTSSGISIQMPNNYIGHHTRYYWEDTDNKTIVRLEAKLTNKRALRALIDQAVRKG